jgi:hypothetical protein
LGILNLWNYRINGNWVDHTQHKVSYNGDRNKHNNMITFSKVLEQ